jgi:hypothetical protein
MDINIFIAILGGLINMILSLIIPFFLKDVKQHFLQEINLIYKTNRQLIITSSLIVALTIYITLSIGPNLDDMLSSLTNRWSTNNTVEPKFINLANLSSIPSCSLNNNNLDENNIRLIISELSSDY